VTGTSQSYKISPAIRQNKFTVVVVPFIFLSNARLALRISNVVALMLLFVAGVSFGASLIATLGEQGFPWSFLGLRWSLSPSSLEDEAAL
jgi:hypothetical protein